MSRPTLGLTQLPVQWVPGTSLGEKNGTGVLLTTHLLLVSWSRKSRVVPLIPLLAVQLYRASVPVQRCTLTLLITQTLLWTVSPVQSLSACTTVHFIFTYTSNPPMERTACTEPQCLYNGALYLYLYLYYAMDRTACTEPQCLYKGTH